MWDKKASQRPVGKIAECGGTIIYLPRNRTWACEECRQTFDGRPSSHYVRLDA